MTDERAVMPEGAAEDVMAARRVVAPVGAAGDAMAGKKVRASRWPWVIIGAILLASLVAGGLLLSQGQGRYAVIHTGDDQVISLPLDGSADGVHEVKGSLGSNTVTMQDGSVWVSESDCPHGDCREQGAISEVGQVVVCLPHKLWVEISLSPQGDGSLSLSDAAALRDEEKAAENGVDVASR